MFVKITDQPICAPALLLVSSVYPRQVGGVELRGVARWIILYASPCFRVSNTLNNNRSSSESTGDEASPIRPLNCRPLSARPRAPILPCQRASTCRSMPLSIPRHGLSRDIRYSSGSGLAQSTSRSHHLTPVPSIRL
jgi:hypothetical protein